MASVLTPKQNSSYVSPKKAITSLRVDRSNSRSNSLIKFDVEFNKQLEEEKIGSKRSFKSSNENRRSVSPLPEIRSIRNRDKLILKETPTNSKNQPVKSPRAWPEEDDSYNWKKKDILKFSPYLGIIKEPEEKKLKRSALAKKLEPLKGRKTAGSEAVLKANQPNKKKEPHYFTYAIGKGNNHQVIQRVMMKRYWWKETYASNTVFDFSWQQSSRAIDFSQLHSGTILKRIVNKLEYNSEIATKHNLIKNLLPYCERHSLDLFRFTPVTFILDLNDSYFSSDYRIFSKIFKEFEKVKDESSDELEILLEDKNKVSSKAQNRGNSYAPRISPAHLQVKLPNTYNSGCNLWLLKPAEFNRGQGINLFNKLATLEHYLKCFHKGADDQKIDLKSPKKSPKSAASIVPCHKFVVQKYIEKPLLIDGRKFDARVWVLVDHEMNLYMFKENYLRLSSEVFNLDETRLEDKYIHLTNNAIQKNGENYGKHESGNIISLNELENYLPKDKLGVSLEGVKKRMKELVRITMDCVRNKINQAQRKTCFELFGYDFILDAEYNVWVIEVNSNPCVEESNELLQMLVPRMIDDALRLTVDKTFVPNLKLFNPEDAMKEGIEREFPVKGYNNQENLWELLGNLKESYFSKKQDTNN